MSLRNKIESKADAWLKKNGPYLITDAAMKRFGSGNIMRVARLYNRWRYAERVAAHRKAFREEATRLLQENGPHQADRIDLKDGFALDTSLSLPHLDALMEQSEALVQERGGHTYSGVQQPFLRDLWFWSDPVKYPAVLDFITSSGVLGPVMRYLQTVPILSRTRPGGIRFMESNAALDPGAGGCFRESQLYHLDIHDTPMVYVLVAVRDIELESGPWTFLPDSVSSRACRPLGYRKRGMSYRVTDEEMYRHVSPEERVTFACPRGSVLFIDSSRCFHYGSRDARPPRFQLMYAFTSVSRADFSMTFVNPMEFAVRPSDSRLRRMVLG